MKKILFSLVLLSATYGVANEKKLYHVNFNSGMTIFDDSIRLEDNAMYGVSVCIYEKETASYGLELGYERLNGVAYEGVKLETDVDRYFVNMLVDGEEELSITPYLLFGGGYENMSQIYTPYKEITSQAFINAGLGFKYRLHDNVNITLEAKAVGKFDTESIDYVGKIGLDFMFGNQKEPKEDVIEVLDEVKEVKKLAQKPLPPKHVKEVKQKKRWITPEIVASEFSEIDQGKIYGERIQEDKHINTMQKSLRELKRQMAENEQALVEKLAKLEQELSQKREIIASEDARLKAERLHLAQEKKAKQEEDRRHAEALAKKAKLKKIAALKKAKRLARAKKIARQKALAEYKRIRLAKEAEERRLVAEKKAKEEIAVLKAAQEKTDVLHVANGMAVFAD